VPQRGFGAASAAAAGRFAATSTTARSPSTAASSSTPATPGESPPSPPGIVKQALTGLGEFELGVGELVADLFISLDGFAAGDDVGPFFGYGGPELDRWIDEHLAEPQEIVFGRRTYEALVAISAGGSDALSGRMRELPKLVVSGTLREPLAWDNTRVVRGDAAEALSAVKQASALPLRTMGSMTLVKSLMRAGLVDRLRLTVFPLILGERGREPAFADMPTEHLLLDHSEVLDGRIVSLEYRLDPARR
jgi:dihydrofolate reductase